jgi:hypothetical protein
MMDRMSRKANTVMAVLFAASLVAIAAFSFPAKTVPNFDVPTGPMAMVDQRSRVGYANPDIEPLAIRATDAITYPWREMLPGWTIQFVPGTTKVAGYTWSSQKHIEVFVRPGDDARSLARVLAHELGHAVDVTLNTADERRTWLAQRNATTDQWWPAAGQADFSAGAGDFAEAFAYWQLRDTAVRSQVGGTPTAADLALLVQLARR